MLLKYYMQSLPITATLNSTDLEIILQYITLTNYYIVMDIQMTSNHSNVNVELEKEYCKQNLNINSTQLDIILHYITLTSYYNVKDTFRSQVITVM